MSSMTMTYNKKARLKKNTFKRTGYSFRGWAKSKSLAKKGKVAYKDASAVRNLSSTSREVYLYAVWKPITYKVVFNANGGKGKTSTKTMTYNKTSRLTKNSFKRSGYVFLGWAKSATGPVVYTNAKAVKNLTRTGETIKLYAVWEPINNL